MSFKKILVIDDNRDINQMIRLAFESENYKVAQCYNGKEGIEKLKTFRPDGIVLDIMMPEMDGLEFIEKLKNHPFPHPLVIIFSNFEWKGYTSNKVYFLKKSDVMPIELVERVKELI